MDVPSERELSAQERAIAEWLLTHAEAPVRSYIPQLNNLRVVGYCDCGCPTVHFRAVYGTPAAEPRDTPVADAFGKVGGKLVGVMLLQQDGLLTCLEVYDLDEIAHPYGLPDVSTLEPAKWNQT